MPIRPFTLPLSIGTDIVHVIRFRDILLRAQSRPGNHERFLRRFLTPLEVKDFEDRFDVRVDTSSSRLDQISKHLAGRWAAKEAAIKAVIWRRISFHDVLIRRNADDAGVHAVILDEAPSCSPSNTDSYARPAVQRDGQVAQISISHDGEYATAVCLAVNEGSKSE